MTPAEAKELERLRIQEATSKRLKEFDAEVEEIDRTISHRSGAWHKARTERAFSRIEEGVDDRLVIRKAMIEQCPALATRHEAAQFEKYESSLIANSFQSVLRNLHTIGVHPPASVVSEISPLKSALHHKIHTALRMMQLEAASRSSSPSPNHLIPPNQAIPQEKREDLVTLKPTIWGMGLNLNEAWRRMHRRFQKRQKHKSMPLPTRPSK